MPWLSTRTRLLSSSGEEDILLLIAQLTSLSDADQDDVCAKLKTCRVMIMLIVRQIALIMKSIVMIVICCNADHNSFVTSNQFTSFKEKPR